MPQKAHQPRLISESESEYKPTPEEQALKNEYLRRLRQYLKDPEFRQIPGFPIGEDDAILDLSDPPYYTACPNPFLSEIIEEWQAERSEIRKDLDLPDYYHREPFAADVSVGKHNSLYKAHTYHTKVPYEAVARYILHYTDPGDIVFDGFTGTGMTGLATQLCGNPPIDIKETIESEWEELGNKNPLWGTRFAIIGDLSPAATFISKNYNSQNNPQLFNRAAEKILQKIASECQWMYKTYHNGELVGNVNYYVWSDICICPNCSKEIVFGDAAYDRTNKKIYRTFTCRECNATLAKGQLDYAREVYFDPILQKTKERNKQILVLVAYSIGNKRYYKKPDDHDRDLLSKVDSYICNHWFPIEKMMFSGEKWGQLWRSGYHFGITHVHHFYTIRNLYTLAHLWIEAKNTRNDLKDFIIFWITSIMIKSSRLMNYNADGIGRVMKGNLYISSLVQEVNPLHFLKIALRDFVSAFNKATFVNSNSISVSTGSAHASLLNDSSIDYIFVDPPFGENLIYSELNFIWEAWLKVFTNIKSEAIVNKAINKQLPDYFELMTECFQEMYRVLKPSHWMTVEFHNSKNAVWNIIQESILKVGFVIADVRTLDKKHGSIKQVQTTGAVKQDLIISAYKPNTEFERTFKTQAGTIEGAWAFIHQHLEKLNPTVIKNGIIEVQSERQPFLLFDRMVAFHIQRGATVPLSAAQFYSGLDERFPKRDGMYFLPDQVPEYDRVRFESESIAQLIFIVNNEKTAIQWLRQQLDQKMGGEPQTYQDVQPKFLRQLHQAKHESLPELSDLLEQNFLQDEAGRWYIPDPSKASDLEQLRQRALLREFRTYLKGNKRLRQFRTEAVRAGFADAYQRRDFQTILNVTQRLPERILQEDPDLLMYYDAASLRAE